MILALLLSLCAGDRLGATPLLELSLHAFVTTLVQVVLTHVHANEQTVAELFMAWNCAADGMLMYCTQPERWTAAMMRLG